MAEPFQIKNGATAPAYVYDLQDDVDTDSPSAIVLTNATKVTLVVRPTGTTGAPYLSKEMDITDAANGRVTYQWAPGDTDTPGAYDVEYHILWSDGTLEKVPNVGYDTIIIGDDLSD